MSINPIPPNASAMTAPRAGELFLPEAAPPPRKQLISNHAAFKLLGTSYINMELMAELGVKPLREIEGVARLILWDRAQLDAVRDRYLQGVGARRRARSLKAAPARAKTMAQKKENAAQAATPDLTAARRQWMAQIESINVHVKQIEIAVTESRNLVSRDIASLTKEVAQLRELVGQLALTPTWARVRHQD